MSTKEEDKAARQARLEEARRILGSTAQYLDGEPIRLPPDPAFREPEEKDEAMTKYTCTVTVENQTACAEASGGRVHLSVGSMSFSMDAWAAIELARQLKGASKCATHSGSMPQHGEEVTVFGSRVTLCDPVDDDPDDAVLVGVPGDADTKEAAEAEDGTPDLIEQYAATFAVEDDTP